MKQSRSCRSLIVVVALLPGMGVGCGTNADGPGPAIPSCAGLTTQCNGESCCVSISVPGGTFNQGGTGSPVEGSKNNPFQSSVSAFGLDKYEVTVGRFRQFVNAYKGTPPAEGAGANPNVANSGWQSAWNSSLPSSQADMITNVKCSSQYAMWTDIAGNNESKPINCLNWYEAFAFCTWDGGRLPTESEWEYAAAGGGENRLYPWGAAVPDCTYANFDATPACNATGATNVASTTKGIGKWGHQDLAGNVWEWALDWYGIYPTSPSNNYANLTPATKRALRGGGFLSVSADLQAAYRYFDGYPVTHSLFSGVRCARTPG